MKQQLDVERATTLQLRRQLEEEERRGRAERARADQFLHDLQATDSERQKSEARIAMLRQQANVAKECARRLQERLSMAEAERQAAEKQRAALRAQLTEQNKALDELSETNRALRAQLSVFCCIWQCSYSRTSCRLQATEGTTMTTDALNATAEGKQDEGHLPQLVPRTVCPRRWTWVRYAIPNSVAFFWWWLSRLLAAAPCPSPFSRRCGTEARRWRECALHVRASCASACEETRFARCACCCTHTTCSGDRPIGGGCTRHLFVAIRGVLDVWVWRIVDIHCAVDGGRCCDICATAGAAPRCQCGCHGPVFGLRVSTAHGQRRARVSVASPSLRERCRVVLLFFCTHSHHRSSRTFACASPRLLRPADPSWSSCAKSCRGAATRTCSCSRHAHPPVAPLLTHCSLRRFVPPCCGHTFTMSPCLCALPFCAALPGNRDVAGGLAASPSRDDETGLPHCHDVTFLTSTACARHRSRRCRALSTNAC